MMVVVVMKVVVMMKGGKVVVMMKVVMMMVAIMIDHHHDTINLLSILPILPKRLISSLLFSSGSEIIMSSGSIAWEERSPLTRELAILPQPMNPILELFERNVLSFIMLLNVVEVDDCD